MKRKNRWFELNLGNKTFAMILGAGALQIGCESPPRQSEPTPLATSEVAVARQDAIQSVERAGSAVKEYGNAQRNELIDNMNAELAEAERELNRLKDKVETSQGEVQAEAKAKLEVAREKWNATKAQLELAKTATDERWQEARDGLDRARQDLKTSINDTRQWIADKIEPTHP